MAEEQSTDGMPVRKPKKGNPRRKPQEFYDKLAAEYVATKTSLREIARRNGCARGAVLMALRERGIEPKYAYGRRSKGITIPPFPQHIDREAFSYWLSGFVAGEGCFLLNPRKTDTSPIAVLEIGVREDERPILETIRSFFGAGNIYQNRAARALPGKPHHHSSVHYRVSDCELLVSIIMPHFEKYHLLAKKQHDFDVWRKGVFLIHSVSQRSWARSLSRPGGRFKWTETEIAEFGKLAELLKQTRHLGPIATASLTAP